MREIASELSLAAAAEYLSAADPVLAPLISVYGPSTLRPHTDYYRELVESIIGQQLSLSAAAHITGRFIELFGDNFPTPQQIVEHAPEDFRQVGFSNAKARYVHDLAQHVLDGKIKFETFDALPNDEILRELTAVKGIGDWTAHMFLMFCMGRLDVLPTGDLGIRSGIMKLYGLDALPTPDEIRHLAARNNWHPYESVASWYIWQSLDNTPK